MDIDDQLRQRELKELNTEVFWTDLNSWGYNALAARTGYQKAERLPNASKSGDWETYSGADKRPKPFNLEDEETENNTYITKDTENKSHSIIGAIISLIDWLAGGHPACQ